MRFSSIQITFDGNRETHGKYKVSKDFSYDNLLSKIEKIMRLSKSILKIRFNICEENENTFDEVLDDIAL